MKRLLVICVLALLFTASAKAGFVLSGDYVRVGVHESGGMIDEGFTVGIEYDATGTATWSLWDFIKPGSPFEFYSIGYGGSTYNTAGYWDRWREPGGRN